MKSVFILLSILIIGTGCTTKGFNRGDLRAQTGISHPGYDDKDIQDAFEKKGNLPKKFKLGVFFKSPSNEIKNNFNDWRWTEADKAKFDALSKLLIENGTASEIFPILNSVVRDDDLRSLRMAAAKHQADALLIISGASQIERTINSFGWSYALILPAFFVPGSEVQTVFVSSATLWDVKNEYLYLTAETEAVKSERYVAAFGKTNLEIVNEAKSESLEKLGVELKKMLHLQ